MKSPPFHPDKKNPNAKGHKGHAGMADAPPGVGDEWDGGIFSSSPNQAKSHEKMRKVMCKANNLSQDPANCQACKTPDACKQLVDEIAKFIADLHAKKTKKRP